MEQRIGASEALLGQTVIEPRERNATFFRQRTRRDPIGVRRIGRAPARCEREPAGDPKADARDTLHDLDLGNFRCRRHGSRSSDWVQRLIARAPSASDAFCGRALQVGFGNSAW